MAGTTVMRKCLYQKSGMCPKLDASCRDCKVYIEAEAVMWTKRIVEVPIDRYHDLLECEKKVKIYENRDDS